MNRTLLSLSMVLFLLGPACAAAPEQAATSEGRDPAVEQKTDAADRGRERHCLRQTGTRIVQRDKSRCLYLPGRVYTQDDLRSTGARDVGEALQRLDPAFR